MASAHKPESGAERRVIDVSAVISGQPLGRFIVGLVLISSVVTLFDGFDMLVLSFLAPYVMEDFGFDRAQMGQLFSAGTFGAMVGGFLFGWLGDRYGRRPTIVLSVACFGLSSAALALAHDLHQLMILRFVNGIALGGLLPLAWALNIEFVPQRYRATIVTLIMMGYTLGGAVAGPVTVWLAPSLGWRGVFLAAGIASGVLAMLLFVLLPESLRFLTARERAPDRIARTLNRLSPGLGAQAHDRFILSDERSAPVAAKQPGFRLSSLFLGPLSFITPLLWTAYIGSSIAIFFKSSWGPVLFEAVGYARTEAAYIASITSITGALTGLALMRFTDRYGPIAIALLPAVAVPVLLLMGSMDLGPGAFLTLSIVGMSLIGGAHFGMHSIAGIFYPSAIRANGAGWATSVAKIGSILGPLIGGYLLATGGPVTHSFLWMAVAPAMSAVALFMLGRRRARAHESIQDQKPADAAIRQSAR